MRLKSFFLSFLLLFFASCNDNKENEKKQSDKQNAKQEIKQEAKVDLDKSFDLNFINSDKILTLQRSKNGLKMSSDDKIIIFNFFTTWCEPCKAQIPHLVHLQDKYKDSIRIVGLLMDDKNEKDTLEFIKEYNSTHKYPINYEISNSENNFFFSKVLGDMSGIPFTAIYNEKGEYINSFLGAVYEEFIDMEIKKVLN